MIKNNFDLLDRLIGDISFNEAKILCKEALINHSLENMSGDDEDFLNKFTKGVWKESLKFLNQKDQNYISIPLKLITSSIDRQISHARMYLEVKKYIECQKK